MGIQIVFLSMRQFDVYWLKKVVTKDFLDRRDKKWYAIEGDQAANRMVFGFSFSSLRRKSDLHSWHKSDSSWGTI